MGLDPVTNFVLLTLPEGLAQGATVLTLSSGDGSKLPSVGSFNLVVWNSTDYGIPSTDPYVEIIRVTGDATDAPVIARGQESTTDVEHGGHRTYMVLLGATKKMFDDISAHIETVGIHFAISAIINSTLFLPIETITNDVTLDSTHYTVKINAVDNDITVTVPSPVGLAGRIYNLKRIDASAFTVTIVGEVDGDSSFTIDEQWENIQIQSDDVTWSAI